MSARKQFQEAVREFVANKPQGFQWVRHRHSKVEMGLSAENAWGISRFLKIILCILMFHTLSLTQTVYSQAPYLGGNGDGYDKGSALVSVAWDITEFDSLTVFPNLVASGEVVYIAVQGIRTKLEILAHDAVGKLVWKTTQWNLDASVLLEMPTENLAAGVYVLDIRVDGFAQKRKIVVQRR
jgi:hypothetical protein